MPFSVQCPQGHRLSVAEKYAGRSVKCPKCSSAFKVPELPPEPVVPATVVNPLESLDFSADSPDPFAADPFTTDPFASPASGAAGAASAPASPHQYYQAATAPVKKEVPLVPNRMSATTIYVFAGAAFAVGFVLTLGLGLMLI